MNRSHCHRHSHSHRSGQARLPLRPARFGSRNESGGGTSGQVMLLAILAIGGTLIAATTIAGLLTVYQLRQASDFMSSAQAVFAADTGIEWGLYLFFRGGPGSLSEPAFTNGATATTTCFDAIADPQLQAPLPNCSDASTTLIRATGISGQGAYRSFELDLGRP